MKIGIFSDTHLGNTMYRSFDNLTLGDRDFGRKDDYRDTFFEAIDIFLDVRPDYVFHLGDLLESKSEGEIYNESLRVAVNGLRKLIRSGIKVVLLEGNHDFVKSHSEEGRSFSILESIFQEDIKRGSLFIVRANRYRIIETEMFPVVAFGYFDENDPNILKNKLKSASDELKGYGMLLMHQSVGEDWPYWILRYSEIPENFRIILNGHIHKPLIKIIAEGNGYRLFINPGSTEYENSSESVDYRYISQLDDDKVFLKVILKGVYILDGGALRFEGGINNEIIPKDHLSDDNFKVLKKCRPFINFDCEDWTTLEKVLVRIKDLRIKSPYMVVNLRENDNIDHVKSSLESLIRRGLVHKYILKSFTSKMDHKYDTDTYSEHLNFYDMREVRVYRNLLRNLANLDREEIEERLREFFGV